MNVAVIGGGYAGMAAAVTLAERGVPVTVFEAGATLGGRARRLVHRGLVLDNGLHVLCGAYRETLRLMAQVGVDPGRALARFRFTWLIHGRFALRAAPLPAPLGIAVGLALARGAALSERIAAARFLLRASARGPDRSVAALLEETRPHGRVARWLWEPLCRAALNTPPEEASARVFLDVLRGTLAAGHGASDLLLPRTDLTRLFPEPAAAYVAARGGRVLCERRVSAIEPIGAGFALRGTGSARLFSHVVCAVAPHQARFLLSSVPALGGEARVLERFSYRPIHSVYLRYPDTVRLPAPMLGFDSALPHWAFDRGWLCAQPGLIGAVISAGGAHEALAHEALARCVHRELHCQLGPLPDPIEQCVIAEKRATFACVPGLERPGCATALGNFFLAGDYTAAGYPATLEAAVRSGVSAARMILGRARGR